MSQLIKKLAEEAAGHYCETFHWEYTPQIDKDIFKKFAELIVRECVTVLERLQDDTNRQNWPTPYTCAEAIKEHFGIEVEK